MKQYLDLLEELVNHGQESSDRTGVGTYRKAGHMMRFDLSQGLPIVTTKKMFIPGVIDELLWFISGSTNINDLPERTRQWWKPWADDNGDLGPTYGHQMRSSRWFTSLKPKLFEPNDPEINDGLFCGTGDLGSYKHAPHSKPLDEPRHIAMLKDVWRDMLKRCYSTSSSSYKSYGAKGVHVCDEWLNFENFLHDAQTLPGWSMKLEFLDEFTIDKDIRHASNRYSRDTCMWATKREQSWNTSTNRPFSAISPDGVTELFASIGQMAQEKGVNLSAVHRCLQGVLHTHHGWSNFKYESQENEVMRFREVDQIKSVLADLKHDTDSRRIVMNLWHSPAMDLTRLPCCHGSIVQFIVINGKLNLEIYQRSADVFIGLPVNLISYALMTHMFAQQTNLEVGELIWVGGDVHLYKNHVEQAVTQLCRTPMQLPHLVLNKAADMFSYKYEDFNIVGYNSHPAIKGEVAV